MNTSYKSVVVGMVATVVGMAVISNFNGGRALAQSAPATPVVPEQYKIVEMRTTPQLFEGTLNQLAKDGWKVRTSVNGSFVILAK